MTDYFRAKEKLENSKALVLDISATLAELEQITSTMCVYWAGAKIDRSLDTGPLDAGYRAMQDRQTVLRRKLVRLTANLQAAHRIVDPDGTHGRSIVDQCERIAREAEANGR